MAKRKKYTVEFKKEAVKLAKRVGLCQASTDLGVPYDNVRRWVQQGSGSQKNMRSGSSYEELEVENRRLRKENVYLKKVSDVLKKSHAIFSIDHIGDSK